MRTCQASPCAESLEGRRSFVIYCSRRCKARELARRYREVNPERKAANARRWRQAHKEQNREINKRWRKENADKWHAIARENHRWFRTRREGGEVYEVTERDLTRLLRRQDGLCAYCHTVPGEWHVDHVIPLTRGGQHSIGNLAWACGRCNRSKRSSTVTEWLMRLHRKLAA